MSDTLINILQYNTWIVYIFRIEQHRRALGALSADLLKVDLMKIRLAAVMSLLIRYAHIPFYFRFSLTFPTSPIHPYAPPLRRDHACACMTIALALSDRSRLFDGHMTYDSHVFTSIISVSTVPPPAVRPITRSRTARSGTFYSFAICSHSCLPFVFNLPVFTFREGTSSPKP